MISCVLSINNYKGIGYDYYRDCMDQLRLFREYLLNLSPAPGIIAAIDSYIEDQVVVGDLWSYKDSFLEEFAKVRNEIYETMRAWIAFQVEDFVDPNRCEEAFSTIDAFLEMAGADGPARTLVAEAIEKLGEEIDIPGFTPAMLFPEYFQ